MAAAVSPRKWKFEWHQVPASAAGRSLPWARPASGDHYSTGEFDQGFRLYVDSLPVLMERQRWLAGQEVLEASWGLSGHTVLGTF